MKMLLVFLALSASTAAYALNGTSPADNTPDGFLSTTGTGGFLGILWGAVPSQAKSAMVNHHDFKLMRSSPTQIEYLGGMFAGIPVQTLRLDFVKGRFAGAEISFDTPNIHTETGWAGSPIVGTLRDALRKKYGKPATTNTGQHRTDRWSISDTASPANAKRIDLFDSWNASVVRLYYADPYFQRVSAPALGIKPDDL